MEENLSYPFTGKNLLGQDITSFVNGDKVYVIDNRPYASRYFVVDSDDRAFGEHMHKVPKSVRFEEVELSHNDGGHERNWYVRRPNGQHLWIASCFLSRSPQPPVSDAEVNEAIDSILSMFRSA